MLKNVDLLTPAERASIAATAEETRQRLGMT